MMVTRPVIRYHGGKFRLAPWILRFFPPHQVYTEAFGGAASLLMQKPRSKGEVYNDLDGDIVNLFRVLREPEQCEVLAQACALTPYARAEFDRAWDGTDDPVERARRTIVRAQMGFGSSGATKSTGFRTDTRRTHQTAQMDWAKYPAGMKAICERLRGVLIENRPAIDVLRAHDGPDTLHFVDPSYVHSTRSRKGSPEYRHELTNEDHMELLEVIRSLEGAVVLSGYHSDLYRDQLDGWDLRQKEARAAGQRGAVMRTECVWLNQACQQRLGGLFAELLA